MSQPSQSTTSSQQRDANTPDFAAIKQKQQATWASGDFAVIGVTLQIVGESLAEAADIRTNERVIDIAAGNGNATLAAARRSPRSRPPIMSLRYWKRGGHALPPKGCR